MHFHTRFPVTPTAVVTGASQGIGRAIAVALAAHGADLVTIGRSARRLDDLASSLTGHDGKVECITADLAEIGEIEALSETIGRRFDHVDILVNCAAVCRPELWAEGDLESFDEHYETNVRGTYALTTMLLPSLIESGGEIVFVNSSIVKSSGATLGHYATTKHALVGLADSLRAEVNKNDVRVMSVYPGRTATPMQEMIHRYENKAYHPESLLQPGDIADVVIACITLPRTAEVTDVHIRPMQGPMSARQS